jgi:hypothetical protein
MYPKEELRGITGEAKSAWVKKGATLYSTALMLYSGIHISSWFEVK